MRVVGALLAGGLLFAVATAVSAQRGRVFSESRDHPSIAYSSRPVSDRVSLLNDQLQRHARHLAFNRDNGYLAAVLAALDVSVDSQVTVFSPTSAEAELINARNPRAIYFNDTVAVGWVRGSAMLELAATDPQQGVIFYSLDQQRRDTPRFTRTGACLECHQTADTLGVPGLLVYSEFSAPADQYGYAAGSVTNQRTPLNERWGGWYVTGHSPGRHLGNIDLPKLRDADKLPLRQLATLAGEFDTRGFLSPYSDIVALLVLEHQTHMTDLLIRVGWETRVASNDARMPVPRVTPDFVDVRSRIRDSVSEVVDYMLFLDEAPLPGRVTGSSGFAERFSSSGPRDSRGRSLRQLDLQRRLMRYPCSYLIYSPVFDALPGLAKEAIYERMEQILAGRGDRSTLAQLSLTDRQAITDILRETKPGFPGSLQRSQQ